MILLDTDVCLSLLSGTKKIRDAYGSTVEEVCVPAPCVRELFLAASESDDPAANRATIEKFLLTVRILNPNLSVLRLAADTQASLAKKGIVPNSVDLLISCMSRIHGARLITTNGNRYVFHVKQS